MTTYQIKDVEVAGEWQTKDGQTLNIVHLTLASNGQEILAERFMRPSTQLPRAGETVNLEQTGIGRDGRIKVKPAYSGAGSGDGKQSGFTPDPERGRRIERQHSQEMALRYIVAKGKTDFTFEDVQKLTDAFCRDLDGPVAPDEVPFDSTNLVQAFDD